MQIQGSLISILCGVGVLNSLFLSIYLFIYKNNTISNKFLGLIFAAISIKLGYLFIKYINYESSLLFIVYVKLSVASYLSIGPLFLFYVVSVKSSPFNFRLRYLVHFIPSILYLIIPEDFLDSYFWRNSGFFLIQLFFLSYLIVAAFQMLKIHRYTKQAKSDFTISNWLKYLFAGIFIIWMTVFFKKYNYFPELAAFFSFALYILLFMFFGNLSSINKKIKVNKEDYCKYNIQEVIQSINDLMVNEKPYLEFDFSLASMSESLRIPMHVLSFILNNHYNQNFREFINSYRINNVKEKILNVKNDGETIQMLAFESGFNSLSVFNTAFKKATKTTPTEYRKNFQKKLSDF